MKNKLILLMFAATLISSCTITRKTVPTAPINFQVNVEMNDLDYLGEVTGSATQHYFLGMPIGGRKYYIGMVGMSVAGAGVLRGFDRAVNNALYDALLTKPDADFVLPLAMETKIQQLFLGKKKEVSVRGKAFRIKTK